MADRLLAGLVLVPFLLGASATPTEESTVLFSFQDNEIVESSGLVAAGGLVVTTNDSGDGGRIFTVDRATLETTRGPWVFDHPFFLILNNAVGGDWPGSPDAGTVLPQDMVIDYVRVYK